PCSAPTQIPEVPTAELPTGSTPRWEGEAALTTGQRVLALDRLPATWTLPTGEHGRSALPPPQVTLTPLRSVTRGGRSWWVQRLPFRLPDSMQRFRPRGMKVWVDGAPAEFMALSMSPITGPMWRLQGEDIHIHVPTGQP